MSTARELADRFHAAYLAARPFEASLDGIPGYDDRVPDDSEAGDAAWRATVESVLAEARGLEGPDLDPVDAVTVGCIVEYAGQELAELESAALEHTVTPMPYLGPPVFLSVAASSLLADPAAAADFLVRLERSGAWIDQLTGRLRTGAGRGRLPVAPLVAQAIDWADEVLAAPVPEALTLARPPEGWDGAAAWRGERDAVAVDVVAPALRRWVELLRELLPDARPADRAGLAHLPGGDGDYIRAIRTHTTLDVTADELHQVGLEEIGILERRALDLGAVLGLHDLAAVHAALRDASAGARPDESMAAAAHAVRRAEAAVSRAFPAPLPAPCAVTAMPHVVAASGMAPHYTPPRHDGSRPGTYWFNTELPAGGAWDVEVVAFHEAVPGHHLQMARTLLLDDLPDLQRQRFLTVFGEGWALYAEQLADELGLYTDVRAQLGAVSDSLLRAARLVVDTGLHAYGWSRSRALEFAVAHVPQPVDVLTSEIDRYIALPGQALAYLTGKRELLRARGRAQDRLGPDFSLADFHGAVLDHGSLPMPVLHRSVDAWLDGR